jgi:hypothetical protein
MITYFGEPGRAGFDGDNCSIARAKLNKLWQKRLYSYFYLESGQSKMAKKKKKKVELFLDSGAFSAWSQKKEIDIDAYIDFIKEHKKLISVYANLDDITDPERTWSNQLIMEQAGLDPIPVYHYGEDIKYLERLLKAKYPYISLGGMVPISTNVLVQWLDRIFGQYLTDDKGMPLVKVHGFGLTSLRLMLRYPWYSVDSTSWVVTGRMGAIYIPKKKGGKWVYDEDSWKVTVSNRSPSKDEKGKHIDTMRKAERKILLEYIEEKGYKLGKSHSILVPQDHELQENERWIDKKPKDSSVKRLLEVIDIPGVSNRYQLRDEINILYFMDLEKSMQKWPWAFKKIKLQKGFFE